MRAKRLAQSAAAQPRVFACHFYGSDFSPISNFYAGRRYSDGMKTLLIRPDRDESRISRTHVRDDREDNSASAVLGEIGRTLAGFLLVAYAAQLALAVFG